MDTLSIADFLSTPAAVVVAGVFGAVWGSFFNVVIARLPLGKSVVRPASHCFACGTPVRAFDNVPILSYLWLRGRCRHCGARFSLRYPAVELLTALLTAALWWEFAGSDGGELVAVRLGRFAVYFVFMGALIVLSFIDLDTKRLPDVITIPGTAILFLAAFAAHDASWKERAIGAAAGYLVVRLIADFYYYVLKREGMGLGDGKLLAMVGATLGWKAIPISLFAGALVGSVVAIPVVLVTRARRGGTAAAGEAANDAAVETANDGSSDAAESLRDVQIPFGPFLAVGALVYLFAGPVLLRLLMPD